VYSQTPLAFDHACEPSREGLEGDVDTSLYLHDSLVTHCFRLCIAHALCALLLRDALSGHPMRTLPFTRFSAVWQLLRGASRALVPTVVCLCRTCGLASTAKGRAMSVTLTRILPSAASFTSTMVGKTVMLTEIAVIGSIVALVPAVQAQAAVAAASMSGAVASSCCLTHEAP
jgi:hypothetical protein